MSNQNWGGYGPPPQQYGPPPQQASGYYSQPQAPQVVVVQSPPVVVRVPFNHTPHIIIDLLTCGAWLPVHLILWACH